MTSLLEANYQRLRSIRPNWFRIEESMAANFSKSNTQNILEFDGGWLTVQQSRILNSARHVWSTNDQCYLFDLSLSDRPKGCFAEAFGYLGQVRHDPKPIGRLYMVPPHHTMLFSSEQGETRTLRCFLNAGLIERHVPGYPEWTHERIFENGELALESGEIEWLLRRMYREVVNGRFASGEVIEMLAKQLAVEVVRKFALYPIERESFSGGLAPWRLRLIRDRVSAEMPRPTVTELAQLCDMTVRHLSRTFRLETGMTIGKYVEVVMIGRAKAKLKQGVSVKDVSSELGYSSPQSFSSAFKRVTGLSPSELKHSVS